MSAFSGVLSGAELEESRLVAFKEVLQRAASSASTATPESVWSELVQLLRPTDSFELHAALYKHVYKARGAGSIRPLWLPPAPTNSSPTNIGRMMAAAGLDTYDEFYRWSIGPKTRSEYWEKAIKQLDVQFEQQPSSIFDTSEGVARATYLPDARLNIAKSCFHRRPPTDVAIVFANESDPQKLHEWTFAHLDGLSNHVAHSLEALGFRTGDTIGICMPMSAECCAVYLGIVKAGMTVVSIADSFSAIEIETRLRLAKARGIVTQDVIFRGAKFLPLYERVLEAVTNAAAAKQGEAEGGQAGEPLTCVVLPGMLVVDGTAATHPSAQALFRPAALDGPRRPLDVGWTDFLALGSAHAQGQPESYQAVILPSTHAANILFSSGTTGEPKAIVWSQATPIKAAIDGHMHQDIKAGEVVCWPTNIGWMMGPWVLFQLLSGATLALFNGISSTADFCRFVEQARVNMLGVVPSLVKSWRALHAPAPGAASTGAASTGAGSSWAFDWSRVSRFSSTGEASDPSTMHWLMSRVQGYAPVVEYCGGTEIGGSFLSSCVLQPNAPSMFSTPVLGSQIFILDDTGFLVTGVGSGEVVLVPPTLGYSTRLLNRDHFECYYAGMELGPGGEVLRRHGDEIEAVCVMTQEEEDLLRQASEAASPQALAIAARGERDWKYYRALGRCDDTMNLGGIKISSVEIERVCNLVDGVHETAAIAVNPAAGGPSLLIVYVVLKPTAAAADGADGAAGLQALKLQLQTSIKTKLNPLFHISDVVISTLLPRTASNKIMRRVLRDEYVTARSRSGGAGSRSGGASGGGLARSATYNASVAKLSSGGSAFALGAASSSTASLPASQASLASLGSLSAELDGVAGPGSGSGPGSAVRF